MQSYHSLYIHLFHALAAATRALDANQVAGAREILIRAQQEAEEAVLAGDILPEETMSV